LATFGETHRKIGDNQMVNQKADRNASRVEGSGNKVVLNFERERGKQGKGSRGGEKKVKTIKDRKFGEVKEQNRKNRRCLGLKRGRKGGEERPGAVGGEELHKGPSLKKKGKKGGEGKRCGRIGASQKQQKRPA